MRLQLAILTWLVGRLVLCAKQNYVFRFDNYEVALSFSLNYFYLCASPVPSVVRESLSWFFLLRGCQ